MYSLNDYDYHLPEALIAQQPISQRDQSRLLHLYRDTGQWAHGRFFDMLDSLTAGDVLVLNNTKVVNGRLLGRKESGGKVEVLILDYARGVGQRVFECLLKASKRPKPGSRLIFDQGVEARVQTVTPTIATLSFSGPVAFEQALEAIGHVPLPPYIQRADVERDRQTYQTVYARHKGAIAAPTAGLHFTSMLLDRLAQKGIRIAYLTLHVGYGTFVPVRATDIRDHRMHAEGFTLSSDAAAIINTAKSEGRRVVAVGTTCVRTLEYCAADNGALAASQGMCDLFIYPGYKFKVVDAILTNFHLPQSTLIMLVAAFAGRQNVLDAYTEAVREKYRFYSYGDAMYIY